MVSSEFICYFNPYTMHIVKNIPTLKKPIKYPLDLTNVTAPKIPNFSAIDLMQLYRKVTNQLEDQLDIKMVMYDFTLLELLLIDIVKTRNTSVDVLNINKKLFFNSNPSFNNDELKFKELINNNNSLRYALYLVKFGRIKTLIGFQVDSINETQKNKKTHLLGLTLMHKINYITLIKKYLQLKLMKINNLKYGIISDDNQIRLINSIKVNKIYHMLSLDKRNFYSIIKSIYKLCISDLNRNFVLQYNNKTLKKSKIFNNNHKNLKIYSS